MSLELLYSKVRDVPDFPKPGILFKDIAPLLEDGGSFKFAIQALCAQARASEISKIVGIESRGFILGSAMAYELGIGFALIRKPGKLPFEKISHHYDLEYESDQVEIHSDAVQENERVLVVDDVLATGGTAAATRVLLEKLNANVVGASFLIELKDLKGRSKLGSLPVFSLMSY